MFITYAPNKLGKKQFLKYEMSILKKIKVQCYPSFLVIKVGNRDQLQLKSLIAIVIAFTKINLVLVSNYPTSPSYASLNFLIFRKA